MRDEEKRLNKTLKESDALIQKGKKSLKDIANKLLPKDVFITPTDGEGSEKKMIRMRMCGNSH